MSRTALPFAILAPLLAATAFAQQPTHKEILKHFGLRAASVQKISVPAAASRNKPFQVKVLLGTTLTVLQLSPHSVRAKNCKVFLDDGTKLTEVPVGPETTYQGFVKGQPSALVAASIVDSELTASIHLPKETWWIQPISDMGTRPIGNHAVWRQADSLPTPGLCGCNLKEIDPPMSLGSSGNREKICDLAVDADFTYWNRYGKTQKSVQAQVDKIVNASTVIYKRDVKIQFKITTYVIRSKSTYTATTAGTLLSAFVSNWRKNHTGVKRDLAHLFTSRSMGNIVGIAYVGVVCGSSGFALSRANYNITTSTGLVCHELGHNFGAGHCNSNKPCYIMCSTLGGCNRNLTKFGTSSIGVIKGAKSRWTCLADVPPTAPPTLASVSPTTLVKYPLKNVILKGTLMHTVDKVTFGTVSVPFTCDSETQISLLLPRTVEIGSQPVQVTNAKGSSKALPFAVKGNHPSVSDFYLYMARGVAMPFDIYTDKKWGAMILVSPSATASSAPGVVSLGIGNNFAEIFQAAVIAADNTGFASIKLTIPTVVPNNITVYWQTITWDPTNTKFPLEVSNRVKSQIVR